jgi:hypothetical protein
MSAQTTIRFLALSLSLYERPRYAPLFERVYGHIFRFL